MNKKLETLIQLTLGAVDKAEHRSFHSCTLMHLSSQGTLLPCVYASLTARAITCNKCIFYKTRNFNHVEFIKVVEINSRE